MAVTKKVMARKVCAAAVMAAAASGALAIEFETESGWRGSVNTTVSVSASWRMQDPDKSLMFDQNSLANGTFDANGAGAACNGAVASAACGSNLSGTSNTSAYATIAYLSNVAASGAPGLAAVAAKVGAPAAGVLATIPGTAGVAPSASVNDIVGLRFGLIPPANGFQVPTITGITTNLTSKSYAPSAGTPLGSAVYQARMAGYRGGSRTDGPNQNYNKGDIYQGQAKVFTEWNMSKGDMGSVVRLKAWYDEVLKNNDVPWGNQASGYARNKPLSDDSQENLNKFSGVELLDHYVYKSFEIGETPVQVRLGKQAVNWGESIYFQGVNQLTPLDVSALRKAGTEIKEALLPVYSVIGSVGLPGGASLDAFYQLKWEPSNIDSCGTYWAPGEGNIGTHGGACGMASAVTWDNRSAYDAGIYLGSTERYSNKPSNNGQWGLQLKFPIDAIDTEIGLYAENIHARVPVLTGWGGADLRAALVTQSGGAVADKATAAALGTPIMAFQGAGTFLGSALGLQPTSINNLNNLDLASGWWTYPEDIRILGISATTTIAGWSVAAELSYTDNLPVQINGNDFLNGMLTGTGPVARRVSNNTAATAGTTNNNTLTPISGPIKGYDKTDKTQLQFNAVGVLGTDVLNFVGATSGNVVGEAAFQWAGIDTGANDVRYGRGFIFGQGWHPSLATVGNPALGTTSITNEAQWCAAYLTTAGANAQPQGCKDDGYMTKYAWGYRLRGQLDYSQVFGTSWQLSPIVFFGQDVEGVSVDNQLNEGKQVLSLTLRANLNKVHNVDLTYTTYADSADYDPNRDKDNVSVVYSYTF